MAGRPWTETEKATARRMHAEGKSAVEIGNELDRSSSSVRNYFRDNSEPSSVQITGNTETQSVSVVTRTIRTLDKALEAAEVDLNTWEVERWVANKWDQGAVIDKQVHATQLWQVKVWLKRRVKSTIELALIPLLEKAKAHAPKYPNLSKRKLSNPRMVEIAIYDHHLGKLCWEPETGSNYDLKIAVDLYRSALEELVGDCRPDRVDQWLLPIGNDFFHIDHWINASTTAGTPQDADSRYPKIMEAGINLMRWAIELLAGIAPVRCVWVGGNHDYHSSWWLCQTLEAWFRHAKHVEFDNTPAHRKYYRYGNTLIGMTHGNMPQRQLNQLPTIMARESRQEWSQADFHEFHIGHTHQLKVTTIAGVPIITCPSLSGTDRWHSHEGYVGMRAAEARVYDFMDGPKGYFQASVKH